MSPALQAASLQSEPPGKPIWITSKKKREGVLLCTYLQSEHTQVTAPRLSSHLHLGSTPKSSVQPQLQGNPSFPHRGRFVFISSRRSAGRKSYSMYLLRPGFFGSVFWREAVSMSDCGCRRFGLWMSFPTGQIIFPSQRVEGLQQGSSLSGLIFLVAFPY